MRRGEQTRQRRRTVERAVVASLALAESAREAASVLRVVARWVRRVARDAGIEMESDAPARERN